MVILALAVIANISVLDATLLPSQYSFQSGSTISGGGGAPGAFRVGTGRPFGSPDRK